MTDLDDARLRAHLDRRSGASEPRASLGPSIVALASSTPQDLVRRRAIIGVRRAWLPLAAVLAGTALVFASATFLPQPLPPAGTASPDASQEPLVLSTLTADELARFAREHPEAFRGQVVIVNADLETFDIFCAFEGQPRACPNAILSGTDPPLPIYPDSDPAYVDDVGNGVLELRGPLALRLATTGHVELIGSVQMVDGAIVQPLESVVTAIDRLRSVPRSAGPDGVAVGPLFVVDAWLVSPMTPECPAQETNPLPAIAGFECGAVGLLTPVAVQPTRLEGTTIVTDTPPGSVRVQNWAYDTFALDPNWSTGLWLANPRRGLYLVRSIIDFPPDACFGCNAAGQAFLIARIDLPVVAARESAAPAN